MLLVLASVAVLPVPELVASSRGAASGRAAAPGADRWVVLAELQRVVELVALQAVAVLRQVELLHVVELVALASVVGPLHQAALLARPAVESLHLAWVGGRCWSICCTWSSWWPRCRARSSRCTWLESAGGACPICCAGRSDGLNGGRGAACRCAGGWRSRCCRWSSRWPAPFRPAKNSRVPSGGSLQRARRPRNSRRFRWPGQVSKTCTSWGGRRWLSWWPQCGTWSSCWPCKR